MTVGSPSEPIFLVNFPPESVSRIIVGSSASGETKSQILAIAKSK